MAFPRTLAVLAAVSALLMACSHTGPKPSATSSSKVTTPTAAPPPPNCGDPTTLPPRDKLAQLLMVGVKNADDARAVVANHHVGGIFIGSWTDLTIFDGPLADIAANPGLLPLAVSVDEEGGRVSRLKSRIGTAPSPKQLAQTQTTQQVHDLALQRGQAMKKLGITIDFAPVVDVTDAPDDTVIGDRSFGSDPRRSPHTPGRSRKACATPGCFRCSSISPATAMARAIRTRAGSSRHRWRPAGQRPGALPDAGERQPRSA